MDINRLCLGCMSDKGEAAVCPHCGWNEAEDQESPLFLSPRTVLNGRYLIGRVLGHGGFGITYLALDINLGIKLAIKEYFPQTLATRAQGRMELTVYTGDSRQHFTTGLEKFIEEAQMLAKFNDHPCIISVHDFFKENGTGYMVMEYIEGITFKQYLDQKSGKIPYETAMEIMMPIMDALREVHTAGLLHRDISPDNIYITAKKQVKLLDFGAARYALGEQSKSLSVILKPGYAPEEQYRSKGIQGAWTDVYAVAATIYRAITGMVPPEALDRMNQDDLQKPSGLDVKMPAGAEKALLKALSVKAEKRFGNIQELQEAFMGERPFCQGNKKPETITQDISPIPPEREEKIESLQKDRLPKTDVKKPKHGLIVAGLAMLVLLMAISGIYLGINRYKSIISVKKTPKPVEVQSPLTVKFQIVPDVVGKTYAEAQNLIENQKLSVKKVKMYSLTVARDIVISQSFAQETKVKPGTEIVLVVSKGPEEVAVDDTVTVPSVVGQTYQSAFHTLTGQSLRVKRTVAYHDTVPKDAVIAQEPPANTKVAKNSSISLTISNGAEMKMVKVPSVVDRAFDEAQKALSALGLKVEKTEVTSETVAKGHVIAQDTAPNSLLPYGTTVTLKVSLGAKSKPITVPLQVKIWTEKQEYKEGDKVRIFISGNKPFYARVVYRDASGNIIQLLPNPYRQDNHFLSGITYKLPSKDDRYELEITPPFGTETAIVYASTAQLGSIDISNTNAGVYMVHDSLNEVATKSRGIAVKPKSGGTQSTDQAATAEFAEAQISLKTEE